jgi:hypothetical protein
VSRALHALIIVAVLVAFSATPRAFTAASTSDTNHPDFTGTWTVDRVDVKDEPKSNSGGGGFGGGGIGGRGGRGGYGRGGGGGGGYGRGGGGGYGGGGRRQGGGAGARRGAAGLSQGDVLRVSQTTDRLIVTRVTSEGDVQSSYTLDGKETKNHPSPEVEIKSKTKWDGAALVTDSTQTTDTQQGKVSTKTKETLSLSEDRQTLTSTMTADSQFGKRTITATLLRSEK